MENLICYKTLPVWDKQSVPQAFQEQHNTQIGTWAKLTILKGQLTFYVLSDTGEPLDTIEFNTENQPPFIKPQYWHKIGDFSDDLECQLSFYCLPEDYYAKKYGLTKTHSEVLNLTNYLHAGCVLDLGCGRGRNSLYLNSLGFDVTAVDHNSASIDFLQDIIHQEQLKNITTRLYDINQATISTQYDLIISTVVMMFLKADQIPAIIKNMQQQTNIGGYNLIVCAMDTDDYPCPMPFSFTFKKDELKQYYQDWQCIKYNENIGELHKTDENGQRIKLRFATLLAKKLH